jgi:hypothetical protein
MSHADRFTREKILATSHFGCLLQLKEKANDYRRVVFYLNFSIGVLGQTDNREDQITGRKSKILDAVSLVPPCFFSISF